MKYGRFFCHIIRVGALATCAPLFALEPANLNWGSVYVTPTLDTRVEYVDNLFRTPDNAKETGLTVIEPEVQAWLQNGLNTYSIAYKLTDWRYFDSSDDDFIDHQFNIDVHHEFNAKNVWNIYGEYIDAHEERGTGLSEGVASLIDEPVEFQRDTLGTDYTLGNDGSKGRVLLDARYLDKEYQNFQDLTQYRNHTTNQLAGTFFWKVTGKTDVLAEVKYQEARYEEVDPLRLGGSYDSDEYNYFLGITWDSSAKTAGSIKLGNFKRTYKSQKRQDDDGFSWEVDVYYKPRTYSVFHLASKRLSQETTGIGDSINTQKSRLNWDHDWNSRSSTQLSVLLQNEDYSGSEREDDLRGVEAVFKYSLRRWADLSAGYRYEERDSDFDLYDYDRSTVFVEAKFSL